MKSTALYRRTNTEFGTVTEVRAFGSGFAVAHYDADAGMLCVGTTEAPTLAAAIAKADTIAKGEVLAGDYVTV